VLFAKVTFLAREAQRTLQAEISWSPYVLAGVACRNIDST